MCSNENGESAHKSDADTWNISVAMRIIFIDLDDSIHIIHSTNLIEVQGLVAVLKSIEAHAKQTCYSSYFDCERGKGEYYKGS